MNGTAFSCPSEKTLRIDVDLGATHQRLTRRFHAVEGSTMLVTIPDATPR
jgi:hypothetical protein